MLLSEEDLIDFVNLMKLLLDFSRIEFLAMRWAGWLFDLEDVLSYFSEGVLQ